MTPPTAPYDINTRTSKLTMYFCGIVASSSFILQPGVVQGLIQYLGLSEQQAGFVASAEMFGVAITAVAMTFLAHRVNWRLAIYASLTLVILGNLMSMSVSDYGSMTLSRFIAGLGHGTLISTGFAAVGLTKTPDRNFGIYITSILTYGAIGLYVMPTIFSQFGITSLFAFFVVLASTALLVVQNMPNSGADRVELPDDAVELAPHFQVSALFAALLYNIAIGITWAYLFLIGLNAGHAEQSVASALTASLLFGVAGALTTTILATRFGRLMPLTLGILGGGASLMLLIGQPTFTAYLIAVGIFSYLWNMVMPFIMASLANFSQKGNMVVYGVAMQMVGFAVAPALGAILLSNGNYSRILMIGGLFFAASFIALLIPTVAHKRVIQQRQQTP